MVFGLFGSGTVEDFPIYDDGLGRTVGTISLPLVLCNLGEEMVAINRD